MSIIRYFALAAAWLGPATLAQAAACGHPTPSAAFGFVAAARPASGLAAESGVQPGGFVELASGKPAVHGIDVSKLQDDTDFETAYGCGARFAYVQLSAGVDRTDHSYRLYWPNALTAGLRAGPLHALRVLPGDAQGWLAADAGARPARLAALIAAAPKAGQDQADLFLSRLDEVLSSQVAAGGPGQGVKYPPMALDLTIDPLPAATPAEKAQFGPVYAALACGFVGQVRANAKTSAAKLILFAEPKVYAAYNLNQNGCGLEQLPVWIAYHTTDGDRFDGASAAADAAPIDALCRPGGAADRCVMQQYSAAASFAVFTAGAVLHLDRFYGSQADFDAMLQTYK